MEDPDIRVWKRGWDCEGTPGKAPGSQVLPKSLRVWEVAQKGLGTEPAEEETKQRQKDPLFVWHLLDFCYPGRGLDQTCLSRRATCWTETSYCSDKEMRTPAIPCSDARGCMEVSGITYNYIEWIWPITALVLHNTGKIQQRSTSRHSLLLCKRRTKYIFIVKITSLM